MYWRRFAVKDIPLDNQEKFDLWLRERWYEKDGFMEEYLTTGRFPASAETKADQNAYIETEVKLAHWWDMARPLTYIVVSNFQTARASRVRKAIIAN